MSVAAPNQLLAVDGDVAFLRVNNRLPVHALAPGVAASAHNIRFEQGKAWPRLGIATDAWGQPYGLVGQPLSWLSTEGAMQLERPPNWPAGIRVRVSSTGSLPPELTEGQDYYVALAFGVGFPEFYFLYNTLAGALAGSGNLALSGATDPLTVTAYGPNTCAYKRFSDPTTGIDAGVLIVDDPRDRSGEDGGRGRAFRILSGNGPQEIPLNGHDVWGECRLVQCDTAMMLLRATSRTRQRYYFSDGAWDATNDTIQLNVTPPWTLSSGRRMRFAYDAVVIPPSGTAAPAPENYYYAKHVSGDKVELYLDSGLTAKLDWGHPLPSGRFFLEEAQDPDPYFGQGPPNLIMQPDELLNDPFAAGFDWMLDNVEITNTDATNDILTAPNHRLQPGDSVTVTPATTIGGWPINTPKFAAPQSQHTFRLWDTVEDAMTDDPALAAASPVDLTTDGQSGAFFKSNAATVLLPPCREGCYEHGRFIGLNGRDLVVVSDPYDFLHCVVFASNVPANLGEAGQANWILPLGDNVLAIGKDLKVIGIANLGISDSTTWTERTITAEYNGLAPLAAVPIGTDIWFASRKGFASIVRTVAGETLGVARPVSRDIPADMQDIDWVWARLMCTETWNNRLFWAVPAKGQTAPVRNNKVLVYNFTNQNLLVRQEVMEGDLVGGVFEETSVYTDSWEGVWTGALLVPCAFARLLVSGEERLTYATADGMICWFHEGWDDNGAEIETELLTRGYYGGRQMLALRGKLNWDTHRPQISASIVNAGVNEEATLAGLEDKTYDPTKYTIDGRPDYDPATSTIETFEQSHRADYAPSAEELLVARLDVHQNTSESFRCRARGTAPQIRLANAQGSARFGQVSVQARPVGIRATRET